MIRWLAILALVALSALPATAQAVRVRSGEHGDFTRLVLEYPGAVDWRVGRTADGYRLRLKDATPAYDLSAVFDLIGRSRLAAIWTDPENGDLAISIACACHAIPFEFRPGKIVIDLKDGPPPKGSSFEEPLDDGVVPANLEAPPPPRPRSRPLTHPVSHPVSQPVSQPVSETPNSAAVELVTTPSPEDEPAKSVFSPAYRWTDLPPPVPSDRGRDLGLELLDRALNKPEGTGSDLEPLRESLIAELGRGATQGIIEMAPPTPADEMASDLAEHGGDADVAANDAPVEIRLGDAPNLEIRQKGEAPEAMTSQGVSCITDDRLAIAEWADETPISEQMGPALDGLVGEFDRPDPEAVARAARFYLHMGFGAEARLLLQSFPVEQEDSAIWLSMAAIIDGEPDKANAFAGMAACDTAAALWALLADPEVLALGQVEKAAVLRGFSALPRHLRQDFGPRLVERFLDMKDMVTATALRESVLRGGAEPTPEIEMMEAALAHAGGSPATSENRLSTLSEELGNSDSAVLAELVTQRAELGQTVSYDQILALEAFAAEQGEGELRQKLDLALTLAHAASGDFDTAFARLDETPKAAPTLWRLLARNGRDSPFLSHAVLPDDAPLPKEARPEATLIAQRLITLGLAKPAARWLSMEGEPPPVLAARVALGLGQAERALQLLGEDPSKPAVELRRAAFLQLGDEAAYADLAAELGQEAEQWRAVSRMRDWPRLAAEGPDAWKEAARRLVGPPPTENAEAVSTDPAAPIGPLERDRNLVSDSEATRSAISALLDSVVAPQPATN